MPLRGRSHYTGTHTHARGTGPYVYSPSTSQLSTRKSTTSCRSNTQSVGGKKRRRPTARTASGTGLGKGRDECSSSASVS